MAGVAAADSSETVNWTLTSGTASTTNFSTAGAISFTLDATSTSYDLTSSSSEAVFTGQFELQNISITVGSTTTLWGVLCDTTTGVALAAVSAGNVTPGAVATFDFRGESTLLSTDTSYTLAFLRNAGATSAADLGVTIGETFLTGTALANGNKVPVYATSNTDLTKDDNLSFSDAKVNGAYGNHIPAITIGLTSQIIPAPPVYTDFYWESGSNEWSGVKWATTDNDSILVALPSSGTVNVVFNNDETAEVSIGDGVSVSSMHIDAGKYTFTGNANSRIEITGSLAVANGATADIQTGLKADNVSVSGTLNLNGAIESPSVEVRTGGVLNWSNTTIGDTATTITNNGTLNISDSTFIGELVNNNTVSLSGAINLQGITGVTGAEDISSTSNGFGTITTTYTLVNGGTSSASDVTAWTINGVAVSGTTDFTGGALTVTTYGTVYYVTVDETTYDAGTVFEGATDLALNGGTLVIATSSITDNFITSTSEGGEIDLNGRALAQSKLESLNGSVILKGNAASVYDLGTSVSLAQNLSLSSTDWAGTVKMGNINTPAAALDLSNLGCSGSSIQLGKVNVQALTSSSQASVAAQTLALGGDSSIKGDLSVAGALTLGNVSKAARLTVDGTLSAAQGITLGNSNSSLTVGALAGNSINISADREVLAALGNASKGDAITLLTVTKGNTSGITALLNGEATSVTPGDKYFNSLNWNGNKLQLSSKANENYISERIAPTSENGKAGAAMLGSLFAETDPENKTPGSTAAALLRAVDAALVSEKELAAVAGSSVTALGMAFSGDVDRQLKAIRNRTTTMGVDQSMVNDGMPYLNAWINAEGNHNEMDGGDTTPGYSLDSWGGTVGLDVDITPQFTMGVALTAMYGDISTDGPDRIDGDMDTYYVSLFGRYCEKAWTHTFVATVGKMDTSLERTVAYAADSYTTKDNADGMSYGLMYELGYVFAVDEESETCLQPVLNVSLRHTSVDGYTEKGSDMALEVGEQELTTCTLGIGARMQSIVGETAYNRSSLFEARILGKADFGDEYSEAEVGLVAGGKRAKVRSEEIGALGIELGAGLTIPLGDDDGAIFMDASMELRSSYTTVNGTLGYRINF